MFTQLIASAWPLETSSGNGWWSEMLPANRACCQSFQAVFSLRTQKQDFSEAAVAGGTSAGTADFLTYHPHLKYWQLLLLSKKLFIPQVLLLHVHIPSRASWMGKAFYNNLWFSLKCLLFLHCILSMRSVLSLVQLCSCSYLAQTSSEFCIHTKSFHLLFERSDKWVQSRGAQSLQGCESGQGEKY